MPAPVAEASAAKSTATPAVDALVDRAFAAAKSSCERGEWLAAKDFMRLAIQLEPGNADAHAVLGNVHCQLAEFNEACDALKSAARLGAARSDVLVQLGLAHLQLKQVADAETALTLALSFDHNDATARRLLADIYRGTGRYEKAAPLYRQLIGEEPKEVVHYVALADCESAAGNWPAAQSSLAQAAQLDPQNDALREQLAVAERAVRGQTRVVVEGICKDISILPGTRYATCAIPLDYPPSRDLRPRWGYKTAPHAGLTELFARGDATYARIIEETRELAPLLARIGLNFDNASGEAGWVGPAVNAIDLALLYYFIQCYRPATYLEIGSGATTCFARRAIADHQLRTKIISIDPDPRASIDRICDQVIRTGFEFLEDLSVFSALGPGDIVFMDGSHRSFMNSDVTVFMLDVLPLLQPGVIVHIHDISLPYDYPEMFNNWYWNEQYMVGVYLLAARDRVQILMPSSYVSNHSTLKALLEPPILPAIGNPAAWQSGGSLWFTHK